MQRDIDRAIKRADFWEDFLKIMDSFGYEIKVKKHITFRFKDKEKHATRGKTIGKNYTENRIKEHITEDIKTRGKRVKALFKPVE